MFKRFFFVSALGLIITVPGLLFIQYIRHLDEKSFRSHPLPGPEAVFFFQALLMALVLSALYVLSLRRLSGKNIPSSKSIGTQALLACSPLLFLWALPLMNMNFLDAADFRTRLSHLGWAILAALLFLKGVHFFTRPDRNISSRLSSAFAALSLRKKLALLFMSAVIVSSAGSVLITLEGNTFAGDEPHYLLITHSLLKDGDFDLKNNYAGQDYKGYMDAPGGITPHTAPGTQGRLSFHSPGISLLLFPFYSL